MSARLSLPPPPKEYSQRYEMIRNREIERVMNDKVSASDEVVFGGVPFTAVRGSNVAFEVPQGTTPVKIPFDVLLKDTDPTVEHNAVNYTVTNPFIMDAVFYIALRHAAAPGGAYDLTLFAYVNDVQATAYTQTIANNETQDFRVARFVVNLAAGSTIDLRAVHNRNGPVTFDLTRSQWDIMRVSTIPRVL
jgi:hypothetical protein